MALSRQVTWNCSLARVAVVGICVGLAISISGCEQKATWIGQNEAADPVANGHKFDISIYDDKAICISATTFYYKAWDTRPWSLKYITEAEKKGLTPTLCTNIIYFGQRYYSENSAPSPSLEPGRPGATPQPANRTVTVVKTSVGSDSTVHLIKENSTFKVPVLINGIIHLNFTVDSGAADVSVPADVVLTLIRTGTITEADFIGERTYVLADGSKVKSNTFRIRQLKVGDRIVQNVQGSIADVNASLLLGQSFLSRFKSVKFDYSQGSLVFE